MRLLLLALAFVAAHAFGAPFLIGDVPGGGDQCVYTRGGTSTNSPIVVDATNGNPTYGNRICKVDLASDPKTGSVTLAVRDSVTGQTSTATSFTFPTVSAPTNLKLIP